MWSPMSRAQAKQVKTSKHDTYSMMCTSRGWEVQGGIRHQVFLRLYLLPLQKEEGFPWETISVMMLQDTCKYRLKVTEATGAHFYRQTQNLASFQMSLVTSGAQAIFLILFCLSSPGHLQEERQTGKASSQQPLSLSWREVTPRSLWGTSHISLARTVSGDHSYKGSFENGNMAIQQ